MIADVIRLLEIMRINLRSILWLFVPFAFLAFALSHQLREPKRIDWVPFRVENLEQQLSDGQSVLVLGLPQSFPSLCNNAKAAFETSEIKQVCQDLNYATMLFEYMPWSKPDKETTRESQWMIANGGYKEPWVAIVNLSLIHI